MKINNLEKFREKVKSGETALGTVISSYDSTFSELAADVGFDFIWIDMEHSPMTIVDAMHHVMAVRGTDCAPFIRVPWNVNYLLKPVLDLAPAGVIIPMINDAASAEAAVKACKYPLYGGERGFALRRNSGYGKMPLDKYMANAEHDPLVIIQIEHYEAVKNIDEILQVSGIDSICIGPFDLSASYGKTAQFDDPEILSAIDEVREKTMKAGTMLGGFCSSPMWKDRFMNWKALTDDTGALAREFRRLIHDVKSNGT
jgi:2-keto-3-deoxy-L-rhamnonate aldolase RhmA